MGKTVLILFFYIFYCNNYITITLLPSLKWKVAARSAAQSDRLVLPADAALMA
jgi:hypothetical protein